MDELSNRNSFKYGRCPAIFSGIPIISINQRKMKKMNVSKEQLLQSGFRQAELQIIQNNIDSYGGTLEEAIQDLANRFRVVIWVFYGCIITFVSITVIREKPYIIATCLSLLITMAIVIFMQPPVLSYKSWRYWKVHRG